MFSVDVAAEEAERILQCRGRVFCLHDEPGVHRVWLPGEESPGWRCPELSGTTALKITDLFRFRKSHNDITGRDEFVVLATDGIGEQYSELVFPLEKMDEFGCHLIWQFSCCWLLPPVLIKSHSHLQGWISTLKSSINHQINFECFSLGKEWNEFGCHLIGNSLAVGCCLQSSLTLIFKASASD
ncbi:hypothetical protein F3Y22_tig00110393pilonHSYRG00169 [Hibiscus syriacus]|uniref:PPM-type phosphatase domain-containing protein n=1 Tax=Hibiscus syriacus TaxID=106335 RepID=A0A6A3AQE4_HIBSY|nr:hypothetical protein F3Y22_tig00110393pilonHSYRG00169 [Hibiscus syriacus]